MTPLDLKPQGIPHVCTGHPFELKQCFGVVPHLTGRLNVEDKDGSAHQQLFYAKSPETEIVVQAYMDDNLVTLTGVRMGRSCTDALHVRTVTNVHPPPRYWVGSPTHFYLPDGTQAFGKIVSGEYQRYGGWWEYQIKTDNAVLTVQEEDINRFWMTVEGKL